MSRREACHEQEVLPVSSSGGADNLSLQELEALVRERRGQATASKVRRFAGAELALQSRQHDKPPTINSPVRAPSSHRTALGQSSVLTSQRFEPLGPQPDGKKGSQERRKREAIYRSLESAQDVRRRRRDGLMFALQLVALATLMVIAAYGYTRLRTLNSEIRQVQRAQLTPIVQDVAAVAIPVATTPVATLVATTVAAFVATPAATIVASPLATTVVILPGRHDAKQVIPLPTSLQELVGSSVETQAPPTSGANAPRRLVIAKIGVDAPVISGDDWEDLKKGIGHRLGTANPGESGNMVVSAHNDIYGEIFRDLSKLEPGDEVRIYTDDATFRYIVNTVEIVEPTRVEVMDPTDYPILTMITCYPYLLDTHRVAVVADLAE